MTSWATSRTVTPSLSQIRCTSAGDGALVAEVEAVERLVEQQDPRAAHQRLGDQQPLLLAAGERADRARRVGARADQLDHLLDPAARPRGPARLSAAGSGNAPARAVEAEAHDVEAANPRVRRRSCAAAAGSRSGAVAAPGGAAEHAGAALARAAAGRGRRRAGSTCRRRWGRGPRRTRPGRIAQIDARPDGATAAAGSRPLEPDRATAGRRAAVPGAPVAIGAALSSPRPWRAPRAAPPARATSRPGSWRLRGSGSRSPWRSGFRPPSAASFSRWTSGVAFWLL